MDGCFWHGCLECSKISDTMSDFWKNKIEGNRQRDVRVNAILAIEGWKVIRVAEHTICRKDLLDECARKLVSVLNDSKI